jgi:hypothetical protein
MKVFGKKIKNLDLDFCEEMMESGIRVIGERISGMGWDFIP